MGQKGAFGKYMAHKGNQLELKYEVCSELVLFVRFMMTAPHAADESAGRPCNVNS